MSPRRLTRVLLYCGVVGPPLFILIFLVDGATRAGYDPTYHPVSALSLGPRGWIQIANFVLTGLLLLAFALGMRRVLRPGRADLWAPLAVGVFGLGLLLSGVFVMDPARGYPPGAPLDGVATSWPGILHDNLGIVVFGSLPVACFVLARRSAGRRTGRGWFGYDLLTGLAGLALLVTFGTAWQVDHPSTGLIQRVMITVGWTWITVLALRLLAEFCRLSPARPRRPGPATAGAGTSGCTPPRRCAATPSQRSRSETARETGDRP